MDAPNYYLDGFIAGPNESEESFLNRVHQIKKLIDHPELLTNRVLKGVRLEKLTNSILYFKSNKKLPFYTAALTWIIDLGDGTRFPILQLPTKKRRFSLAKQEEVIAHEKVHALRAAFKERMFEEILAYRTSPSKFRRFVGPIFATTTESKLFLLSLIPALFYPMLSLLFFSLLFVRLIFLQGIFWRALSRLTKTHQNPEEMITLLTDQEILNLAKGNTQFLEHDSPRMKQIHENFEKLLTVDTKVDYLEDK